MAIKTKVIKSHKVSFMQLNCAKTHHVMSELEKLVQKSNDKDLHIISLQEPSWQTTKANRLAGFKDLRSYHHPHTSDNRCRAVIVASRELNCFPIYDFTGPDVATVLTEIDGKNVYICSAYLDGTNNIDTDTDNILPEKLMELLKHVRETNKELILCTDSNSHSTEWFSPLTDKRGEIIEDILKEFNLKLLNNSSKPTFVGACATKGGTHIDLTAVTVGLVSKLNKWEVTDEVHSDHNLIRFRARNPHNIIREKAWSFKKGDWEMFKHLMSDQSKDWTNPEVWTTEVIDKEVKELYNHINRSLTLSCPMTSGYGVPPSKTSRTNSWWNRDVSNAKKKLDVLKSLKTDWKREINLNKADKNGRQNTNNNELDDEEQPQTDWNNFMNEVTDRETDLLIAQEEENRQKRKEYSDYLAAEAKRYAAKDTTHNRGLDRTFFGMAPENNNDSLNDSKTSVTTEGNNKQNTTLAEINTKEMKLYIKDEAARIYREGTRDTQYIKDISAAYKAAKNSLRYIVKTRKNEEYKNFASSISNISDMSKFSRGVLDTSAKVEIGQMQKPNGKSTQGPKESVDVLFKHYFPGAKRKYENNIKYRNPESPKTYVFDKTGPTMFNATKLKHAFKEFKNHKAPGPDGLKPIVLKNLDSKTLVRLAHIYEACYKLAHTPDILQESIIAFIPKPGKKDYTQCKSWRPITLLNFLFKGLEKVILRYLQEIYGEQIQFRAQHAYTCGKSTETAIAEVVNYIEQTALRNKHCYGTFLDISGAYNNAPYKHIINALRELGLCEVFITFIENFLYNRQTTIKIGKARDTRTLIMGVSQGSILSCLLWNSYINPLLTSTNQIGIGKGGNKVLAYADDIACLNSGTFENQVHRNHQRNVNKVSEWIRGHGLKVEPSKCDVIYFTMAKKNPDKKISIDSEIQEYSKNTRYLGLTLSKRLDMTPHIENKIKACSNKLWMFKMALGKTWGPKPNLMRFLYTQIIRPGLTYACFSWAHTANITTMERYKKLDSMALRSFATTHKSTPTSGLQVMFNVEPIDLTIKYRSFSTLLRIDRPKPRWDGNVENKDGKISKTRQGFFKHWIDQLPKGITRYEMKADWCYSHYNWTPGKHISTVNPDKLNYTQTWGVKNPYPMGPCWRIHTDCIELTSNDRQTDPDKDDRITLGVGSCEVDEGGHILYKSIKHFNKEVGKENIELAEATQMLSQLCPTQLKNTINGQTVNSDVIVFSNFSKASLNSRLIQQATLANFLKECKRVSEITGNRVYVLNAQAKTTRGRKILKEWILEEAPTKQIEKSPFYDTTLMHTTLNEFKLEEWNNRWANLDEAKQTKLWFPRIDKALSKDLLKLTRVSLGQIIGFISGHNHLLRHQRKIYNNPYMDVTCRACEEPGTTEDASHLWSTCKALRHIRSIVHEWPEDNHESDENIESTQRTSLAAFSSGTVRTGPVRRTLESPFEWVPEQLSRFLTDPTIATLLEHPGQ